MSAQQLREKITAGLSDAELAAAVTAFKSSAGAAAAVADAGAGAASTDEQLRGARGALFDAAWLEATRPLAAQHMGVENMGPMLYALVRFLKPRRLLEVGAGYTTLFILQALADNAAELQRCRGARSGAGRGEVSCAQEEGGGEPVPWCVEEVLDADEVAGAAAVLVAVDNEEHEVFTELGGGGEQGGMALVSTIATKLGLERHYVPVVADCFDVGLEELRVKADAHCGLAADSEVGGSYCCWSCCCCCCCCCCYCCWC